MTELLFHAKEDIMLSIHFLIQSSETHLEAVVFIIYRCVTNHLNMEWFKGMTILLAHNSVGQQFELASAGPFFCWSCPGSLTCNHPRDQMGSGGLTWLCSYVWRLVLTVDRVRCLQQANLGFFQRMAEFQDSKPQCAAFFKPLPESRLLMSHCQRKSHSQAQSQCERGLTQGERIHQRPLLNNLSWKLVCYYPCFISEETGNQKG